MNNNNFEVKRFEIYACESHIAAESSAIICKIPANHPDIKGTLWRVSFPFNIWVWETELLPYTTNFQHLDLQKWQQNFTMFPAHLQLSNIWNLAVLTRNGKNTHDIITEYESVLSAWTFQYSAMFEIQEFQKLWQSHLNLGADAFLLQEDFGIFIGDHFSSIGLIWVLLQRYFLDKIDKQITEFGEKRFSRFDTSFKINPWNFQKHQELKEIYSEILTMKWRFSSIIEPIHFSQKFFNNHNDDKFYQALIEEMNLHKEVKGLSERLESLEKMYSLISDHITKFNYFFWEFVMEATILLALFWEIYLLYQGIRE